MNSEQIIVEVSPSGEVKVSVKGVKGKACKDLTKKIEEALGEASNVKETEEYYQEATQRSQHTNKA
jgi:acylphosphatase